MRYYTSPEFTILPGSGINAHTLKKLLWRLDDLSEIHLTASSAVTARGMEPGIYGTLQDHLTDFGFGSDQIWTMDKDKLRAVFEVIDIEGQMDGIDPNRWMPESHDGSQADVEHDIETDIETDED